MLWFTMVTRVRAEGAALLATFLAGLAIQLSLHAHLDGRHHDPGCEEALVDLAHDHPTAAHPGRIGSAPDDAGDMPQTPHGACAPCSTSLGDVRARSARLETPAATALWTLAAERPRQVAHTRSSHRLRGPPLES